jgi:DNA-binding NarL/FixJ family response regulator
MINVAIANEQGIYCEGLSSSLERQPDFRVVFTARSKEQFYQALETHTPDIVLIDLKMNGMEGYSLCEMIKHKYSKVKVIILSTIKHFGTIADLIAKGANAYLLNNSSLSEVYTAIKMVHEKNYYFTPLVSEALAIFSKNPNQTCSPLKLLEVLSEKEKQVLRLICLEYTTKQMAYALKLSPRTIEFHRKSLLEKTNSVNVAGLVIFAFRSGFIE